MDTLVDLLDQKLRQWKPETSRSRIGTVST
jgi:hypothetical protein